MLPKDITVLTLTLPDRADLLQRNCDSVDTQTAGEVYDHLIDGTPGDVGLLYNRLVETAETEWVCLLDDDNFWLPDHLASILPSMAPDVDVVYSWESSGSRPRVNVNDWDRGYVERLGRDSNWLDTSCAVRRFRWLQAGGMPGPEDQLKDWTLWRRMVASGARFRCVPEVTWHYTQYAFDGHVFRDPNLIPR